MQVLPGSGTMCYIVTRVFCREGKKLDVDPQCSGSQVPENHLLMSRVQTGGGLGYQKQPSRLSIWP